jgi:hypothetical protein
MEESNQLSPPVRGREKEPAARSLQDGLNDLPMVVAVA